MSECVVRMEMPRNCMECQMRGASAFCPIGKQPVVGYKKQRHEHCPIVAVLPENHGRLVDADAEIKHQLGDFESFEAEHGKEETYGKLYSINDLWIGITEAFDTADIIVPATERSEA